MTISNRTVAEASTREPVGVVDEYDAHVVMSDTDMAGVIYVATPVRWAQVGFENLLRSVGMPLETIVPRNLHYPMVSLHVEHHAPLRLGNRVTVQTFVAKVGRRSVVWQTRVFGEMTDAPVCTVTRTGVATARDGTDVQAEEWLREMVVAAPPEPRLPGRPEMKGPNCQ